MKRRTHKCQKCDKDVSLSNYDRHVKVCGNGKQNRITPSSIDSYEKTDDGKYICPICETTYNKYGIATHMWRAHGLGKNHNPNSGYVKGTRKAWNKDVLTYDELFYSDEELVKEYLVEYGDNHSENTIRKHMKNHLIKKNGNVCSVCDTQKWCGVDVPLVCDHIDGQSENHDYDNFRLVCGNCDMLLPTYKSKNRGNGRKERRKK